MTEPTDDLPQYVQTLNDLMDARAADWTDEELEKIIIGFRQVLDRWNAEQSAGSRKLVRTSGITTSNFKKKLSQLKL